MTQRKIGRRTKLTKQIETAIVEALNLGATYKLAADAAGISEGTFYRWMRGDTPRQKQFQKRIKAAQSGASLDALDKIQRASEAGSWQAAAWLLERRHPSEYGRNRREKPTKPSKQEQAEIADPPKLTMEVMGATWIRSLQVAEREYAEGQLSAADYLRAVTALSGLAGRAMEIASRQADAAEVPPLEVSVSLESPHMIESPTPSEPPGQCGDSIEVS